MSKFSFAAAFGLGLALVAWIAFGFVGASWIPLLVTAAIAATFLLGAGELRRYRAATEALRTALAALADAPPDPAAWIATLPPALRHSVRLRIEGERAALPAPALTPYLVGLLVMLGMLGTFLGMVVTFKGAVFALEGSTDLQAIRAALAEPIKGLGLSFGTSVAGVAASAMLGLMAAIARRERIDVARLLDARIGGVLRPWSLVHQRQETYRALQQQAGALPQVAESLHTLLQRIELRSEQLDQQLLQRQAGFEREVAQAYAGLAERVGASLQESLAGSARAAGDTIRPVVENAMAQLLGESRALQEQLLRGAQVTQEELRTGARATHEELRSGAQATHRELQAGALALHEQLHSGAQELHAAVSANTQQLHAQLEAGAKELNTRLEASTLALHGELRSGSRELGEGLRTGSGAINEALLASSREVAQALLAGSRDVQEAVRAGSLATHEALRTGSSETSAALRTSAQEIHAALHAGASEIHEALGAGAREVQHTLRGSAREVQEELIAGARGLQEELLAGARSMHGELLAGTEALQQRVDTLAREQVAALAEQFGAAQRTASEQWSGAMQPLVQRLEGLLLEADTLVQARREGETRWLAEHGARVEQAAATLRSELGALRDEEAKRGDAAVQRLAALEASVAQHLAALGAALEAPITRLLRTAAEVPQAAAGVITQLREEMGRVAERDNASLQERTVLLERLAGLLQVVQQATGEQRSAINALLASASSVLDQAGERFATTLAAQAQEAAESSAHVAAGAVELASLGEAFAQGVQLFQGSSERLVETLQRIETTLQRSTARSDEQLAYYVAQAREVIDLSIASQQGLVENLRALRAPAAVEGAA